VARDLLAIWNEISTALLPIVGTRGLAALCRRSLHLSCVEFAWLSAAVNGKTEAQQGIEAICALLALQDAAAAAACAQAFLQIFRTLLATLIGVSLTERLLRPAWIDSISGPAAQDTLS
jgi:hypothetical protein